MIKLEIIAGKPSGSMVILADKKNIPDGIDKGLKSTVESFVGSDKKFDFIKSVDSFIFLIDPSVSHEELRVTGHKTWQTLSKEIKSLTVFGARKSVNLWAEGFLLSSYSFQKYKKKADRKELEVLSFRDNLSQKDLVRLNNVYQTVHWTRDLVNEPVSYITAEKLGEEIKESLNVEGLSVRVLGKTQIESLKMGGLLAVNKGSIDPPSFTIIEYKPKKAKNARPIVLVGKGVVYDTGGLSLKPTPGSMDVMKSDMAGAAAVAGAIRLAALSGIDAYIIGLIPATDNRPGGNAYTPGDVILMFDGTTVEVLNTDAEGRMILADAIAYADKFKPQLVISLATLTGAAVRAIGTKAAITMGNAKDEVFDKLEEAGSDEHERVVRFPFWDEYGEEMKSDIADLKNIGGPNAGMITAGKFLENFTKHPYIHLDIAGPAWLDAPENYKGKGGTGYGVRLLCNFMKKMI